MQSPEEHRVRRRAFLAGGLAVAAGVAGAAVAARSPTRPLLAPGPFSNGGGGEWGPLVSMGRVAPIHASVLSSGKLLMTGVGGDGVTYPTFVIDPTDDGPFFVDPMRVPMRLPGDSLFCAGHSYLADGRLLQVGGGHFFDTGLPYALVFAERAPRRWTPVRGDLFGGPAWYATVTRMADHTMLVLSGFTDFGLTENRTVQLFDPARFDAGEPPWTLLVPHRRAPEISATGSDYTHTFVLPKPIELEVHLRDVVMIGKTGEVHFFSYMEPFDDPSMRFATRANGLRSGPEGWVSAEGASSVLLADGRILIAGHGGEGGGGAIPEGHIYDPAEDAWRTIDTGIARSHPAAVLLPDTTVALVNGNGGVDDPRCAQIIDPVTEAVTTGPPWDDLHPRGYHNVALLLPDGTVLVAGGQSGGEDTERPDLRIYVPPYLVGVAPEERPKIVAAPAAVPYGRSFPLLVDGGPIHRVTLLALGSMTHAWDANQRCVQLFDGEARDPQLSISAPRDANAAPPGTYMLFAMRRDGAGRFIPSVASMVRVG